MNKFIALDLETTGLDFDKDQIIEIALAKFENGEVSQTLSKIIKPQQKVREFIVKLTGISRDELSQGQDVESIMPEVIAFIGDLPIVAHNANFDKHFFHKTCDALSIDKPNNMFLDTLWISRLAWHHAPNHKLETLVQFLNLPQTGYHRALPDAIHCGQIFLQAFKEISSWNQTTLNQISFLVQETEWAFLWPHQEKTDFTFSINKIDLQIKTNEVNLPECPSQWLEANGPLSQPETPFLPRRGQKQMTQAIHKAFHSQKHLVIEAETGVGKTLSYLSSIAHFCIETGNRVLLSVSTKILQEQLWYKELPKIQELCGEQLRPAILKGRSNYINLSKINALFSDLCNLSPEDRLHCVTILPWLAKTTTGDISENKGFNAGRNQILWQKICCDSTDASNDIEYYSHAKAEANKANLLIVNHALFFKDMELDFGLLPTWEYVVFDEAHKLPSNGQSHLNKTIWFYGLRNTYQLLYHPYKKETGYLFSFLKAHSDKVDLPEHIENLIANCKSLEKALHKFFVKLGKNIRKTQKGDKIRFQDSLALEYNTNPEPVFENFQQLEQKVQGLQEYCANWAPATAHNLLNQFKQKLETIHQNLLFLTDANKKDWVYWVEEPGNPHKLKITASPLHIDEEFKEKLFPWLKSAIFTSATLSVSGSYRYFKNQIGLPAKVKTLNFESPFDLESQQKVFCVKSLAKPNTPQFQNEMDSFLQELLPKSNVAALALYTNVGSLMKSQKALQEHFGNRLLLAQHVDGNMDNLLNIAKNHKSSTILGTQIFWEGIDLPGDALELLVITKLPFPNPNDPLIKAKSEQLEAEGKTPFAELMIPEAVLELKQGMGRLIRTSQDKGAIVILDSRVVNSGYSHSFTNLWKSKHEVVSSADEVLEKL